MARLDPGDGRDPGTPRHFADAPAFRDWLAKNHDACQELWVGFYKKNTGLGGLTYAEAVDQALCFGWIDGIKKRVDDRRYTNRFTPRRPHSNWSAANLRRYAELEAEGLVTEAGRSARARWDEARRGAESAGAGDAVGRPAAWAPFRRRLEAHGEACSFHDAQPPGYRRLAEGWIVAAKREATRNRRFERLLRFSAAGERVPEVEGRPARKDP